VLVQNLAHTSGPPWLPGVIMECCDNEIQMDDSYLFQRHADHIIAPQAYCNALNMVDNDDITLPLPAASSDVTTPPTLRRSQRNHRPPDQFKT